MGALLLFSGCIGTIQIKNETLYFPLGSSNGAVVEHTLDNSEQMLTDAQFKQELDTEPTVVMSADAYGRLKSAIEKLCSISIKYCSYEDVKTLNSFFLRVDHARKIQNDSTY